MRIAPGQPWYKAQTNVASWLRLNLIPCAIAGYYDPYDVRTRGGQRVEVKYDSYSSRTRGWVFNIHRHGKLSESEVDFYILRCEPGEAEEFLGSAAFHLVMPAPLECPTISVTVRSLLCGRWAKYYNNLDGLKEKEGSKLVLPSEG